MIRFDAIQDELEAAADPGQARTTPRAKPGEVEVVPELSPAEGLSLDERAVLLATAVSSAFRSDLVCLPTLTSGADVSRCPRCQSTLTTSLASASCAVPCPQERPLADPTIACVCAPSLPCSSGHSSGMGFPMMFPFFGGGAGVGSELDPAPTEGPAAETAPVNPTVADDNDVPLPAGMQRGSVADELAREERRGAAVGEGAGDFEDAGLDGRGGEGDGVGPQVMDWWERDALGQAGEGEELLEDPWAADEGGDWGDGSSEWP